MYYSSRLTLGYKIDRRFIFGLSKGKINQGNKEPKWRWSRALLMILLTLKIIIYQ